jgi:hypothetical protein
MAQTKLKKRKAALGAAGRKKAKVAGAETVKALKARLKARGLPVSGKKAVLLARLAAAQSQPEAKVDDEPETSASPAPSPHSPSTGEADGAAAKGADASTLTVSALKAKLKALGLPRGGKKLVLVERLREHATPRVVPAFAPPLDAADVTWATDATHPTKKPMYAAAACAPPKTKRAKKGAASAEATTPACCIRCLGTFAAGARILSFDHIVAPSRFPHGTSYHIECFCKYPPKGIAAPSDVRWAKKGPRPDDATFAAMW